MSLIELRNKMYKAYAVQRVDARFLEFKTRPIVMLTMIDRFTQKGMHSMGSRRGVEGRVRVDSCSNNTSIWCLNNSYSKKQNKLFFFFF